MRKQSINQLDNNEVNIIVEELEKTINNNVLGDVVEFGCYMGKTSVCIADLLKKYGDKKRFYVYDSFEGLPDKTKEDFSALGNDFKKGELLASKKEFIKNIRRHNLTMPIIKKAWFCDLRKSDVPTNISFAFLDGDYYDSIKDSFSIIADNLSDEAVIVVDDYGNDALPGVKKAVNEWLAKNLKYKIKQIESLAIISY